MKKELELYVHIPFCVKKCAYCDFLSFSAKQEEVSAYVEALAEEIKGKKEQFSDYCVTTIFLGGGTPSILEGVYTASIFRALRESFDINVMKSCFSYHLPCSEKFIICMDTSKHFQFSVIDRLKTDT